VGEGDRGAKLVLGPSPAFAHEQGRVLLLARPTTTASQGHLRVGGFDTHEETDEVAGDGKV